MGQHAMRAALAVMIALLTARDYPEEARIPYDAIVQILFKQA